MAFTPYTNQPRQPVGSAEYGAGQPAVGYDNPQRNVLAQALMAQARPPGGVGTMNNVSDPLMPSMMSGMGQPGMPQTQPAATGTTAPPLGPMGPLPGPAAPPNLLGVQPGQLPPGMAPGGVMGSPVGSMPPQPNGGMGSVAAPPAGPLDQQFSTTGWTQGQRDQYASMPLTDARPNQATGVSGLQNNYDPGAPPPPASVPPLPVGDQLSPVASQIGQQGAQPQSAMPAMQIQMLPLSQQVNQGTGGPVNPVSGTGGSGNIRDALVRLLMQYR